MGTQKIFIVSIWFMLLAVNLKVSGAIAPSPSQKDPLTSGYMLERNLPTDRPITHMLTYRGILFLGCDEGLYYRAEDAIWRRALHYGIHSLYVSGGKLFVKGNKMNRKAARVHFIWLTSNDGKTFDERGRAGNDGVLVYDSIRKISYLGNYTLSYESLLYSSLAGGERTPIKSDLLRSMNQLAVQSRSGNVLIGCRTGLRLIKEGSIIDLNPILGIEKRRDYKFRFFVDDTYMVVEFSSRIFTSINGGDSWSELTGYHPSLKVPRGKYHLHHILSMEGDRLLIRKNRSLIVLNMKTERAQEFFLPTYYRYIAHAFHGDNIWVSGILPSKGGLIGIGKRMDGDMVSRSLVLRLPLRQVLSAMQVLVTEYLLFLGRGWPERVWWSIMIPSMSMARTISRIYYRANPSVIAPWRPIDSLKEQKATGMCLIPDCPKHWRRMT